MKIKEVIATRRTIHDYLNQDFDFGWVEEAVTLALLAPNHRASFPWVFYVLEAETKRSVISLELELKSLDKKLSSAQTQLIEKKYRDPKVIMALGMKRTENQQQSREDYASIACGVQNISLFLWAKGIGCKWSTGKASTHQRLYDLLGVNEEEIELLGFLYMGVPARIPKPLARPSLSQVLFFR